MIGDETMTAMQETTTEEIVIVIGTAMTTDLIGLGRVTGAVLDLQT